MTNSSKPLLKLLRGASISALLIGPASLAAAQDAHIVQPGAPGEDTRTLSATEAIEIANSSYSQDDVIFMRNMIPHHSQAVEMAALVGERTNSEELKDIAGRITASQADEIEFMRGWLADRNEKAPPAGEGHSEHAGHGGGHAGLSEEMMANMGMATTDQMVALAAATGTDFDRQFLTLMIRHHEGAVTMVNDLQLLPGSAFDPVLFDFTNDILNDQTTEIERMNVLLSGLSDDARVGLAAGFEDAGEAISNLTLVASLPKPSGFFDPENPAGLPAVIMPDEDDTSGTTDTPQEAGQDSEADPAPAREDDEQSTEGTQWGERSPLLSFSNTDMAFSDDIMITGSYHGFNIYKLSDDGMPSLVSSVVCPGGQGDVSVVGDLLIMSVEQIRGRVDCGREGIAEDVSAERFRGLRIFDISDLARPRQVGQVQTCRGSHTHSVVSGPDADGKIIVYNSGTSIVRNEQELAGCYGEGAGDNRTALFRIDVIEIPVEDPASARIVDSPAVFADEETGRLAGLWQGGDHGDDTQFTSQTDQCHDITVFPEANLAAGACSGNGIIFDISDPLKPTRIDAVTDTGFAYWHSATFNNDGTKVLFTDEWGGGARPRCRAYDPKDWGADAIYNIVNGKLEFEGYYKISAPQTDQENCVAHNGSIIPVPGRDIFAQAWYQGGLSVMDFTDSANATEIAYFDRGPVHEERLVLAGYWSTYWYNGKIYGTEIARGLDVLSLEPSEHLSENEIAAAALADQGALFNPQQQFAVTWPAEPVVARAYIDQLNRADALSGRDNRRLNRALSRAESRLADDKKDARLAGQLDALANRLSTEGPQAKRNGALAGVLSDIAARLRDDTTE